MVINNFAKAGLSALHSLYGAAIFIKDTFLLLLNIKKYFLEFYSALHIGVLLDTSWFNREHFWNTVFSTTGQHIQILLMWRIHMRLGQEKNSEKCLESVL